jgi:transglutaminase-like putative cysteine protease
MAERGAVAPALSGTQLGWLAGSLALAVLPHAGRVPLWATACFVALAGWRVAEQAVRARAPAWPVRLALSAAILAGVLATYGSLFGRNPGVALLVAFSGLKLMETRSARDAFVGVVLGYFLVATHFLFSESIPSALFMLVAVTTLTATLVGLEQPLAGLGAPARLGLAGTLLLQASPLALALFVLFPRLPGPLWALPADAHGALSGLDESMSPGQISRLGLSEAIAFRARFEGPTPPVAELYWRGPVLWGTDGRSWGPGESRGDVPPRVNAEGPSARYSVTLEPHGRRWMFVLDAPLQTPAGASLRADLQVLAARPVRERLRYEAVSATRYRLASLSGTERREALALPEGHHPRAIALAQGWRGAAPTPTALVERALRHFREEPFAYTLTPPLLLGDPVDEFLFGTRRGFCEHYAAAFTVLMRAAGVPARVVTGYQGGELNPLDGYLVVRQRDAHAWSEVWLDGTGWVRVDPTAAVSPSRIERGTVPSLAGAVSPLIAGGFDDASPAMRLLRGLRFGWEAAQNAWNQWVLGYTPKRQRELLARVGLDMANWGQLAGALAAFTGVPLLVLGLWLALRGERSRDPVRRLYDRFCGRLARRGLVRAPAEPPLRFARRAAAGLPERAQAIASVTDLYVRLRYGPAGGDIRQLRTLVRAFRA